MPPGRPRRKPKPVEAPAPLQPQHRYYKPIKEEPLTHLHDESDLISFRTDAMARFIRNQELLEAIGKYVHSDKIAIPRLVPDPLTLVPDGGVGSYHDVYFGDLPALKKMSSEMAKQEAEIRQQLDQLDQQLDQLGGSHRSENGTDKNAIIALLTEQSRAIGDAEGLAKLEEKYKQVQKSYNWPQFRRIKYQLPRDMVVEEAPADYDPHQNYYYDLQKEMGQSEQINQPKFGVDQQMASGHMTQVDHMEPIGMDGDMDADIFLGDDMMNGIDEDFLSQIDHSME